jgi:MSHA pilin protein MshD
MSGLMPQRRKEPSRSFERGASLVELIMFIVIVSVALAGIMLVINQTSGHSADTLLRKQAETVAESLLEEIQAHGFSGGTGLVTQANRTSSHSIFDYGGYTTGASGILPADGTASAVSGLSNYNAVVVVTSGVLGILPAASAVQITVTVTDPVGNITTATGYRTNY